MLKTPSLGCLTLALRYKLRLTKAFNCFFYAVSYGMSTWPIKRILYCIVYCWWRSLNTKKTPFNTNDFRLHRLQANGQCDSLNALWVGLTQSISDGIERASLASHQYKYSRNIVWLYYAWLGIICLNFTAAFMRNMFIVFKHIHMIHVLRFGWFQHMVQ